MRILLIEDDAAVAKNIELSLAAHGMVCDISALGSEGLEVSKLYDYNLVILDLMLPDMEGLDVLSRLRSSGLKVPILILSGINEDEKKIHGLSGGADDYLTKPFNQDELVARVKAIIRRSEGHATSIITVGDLSINLEQHSVVYKGEAVYLTNKEQNVIEILALKKNNVIPKEVLINSLYNGMDEPEMKIIDVFICKMRKKLMKITGENFIETVWGRGYYLKDPQEAEG